MTCTARMLFLRDHGRLPGDVSFRSVEVAWKYKMSELQAALGRVQLDRIDELIAKKRQIFGWYAERLAGSGIALNVERPGERATYWMVTGGVRRRDRASPPTPCATRWPTSSIATRPFFPPLSDLPGLRRRRPTPAAPVARTRPATTWPAGPSTCRRR